jgi:tetratricopeptide (TPR) repeat protein
VNFHALGEYAAADGGQAHFASHEADGFCMAALVWDGAGRDCGATREAFRDVMDLFGPAEFFSIVKSLERTASDLTCQEMLAHLRWSAWDPQVLHTLLPSLRERLPAAPPTEIAAWRDAMARVWSLYYHFDAEEGDLAFGIGATFARLGEWKAAITFFERSRQLWGDDGNTLYNLGVCHARLGDRPAALACVEGVLAAKPDHEQALKLRRELGTKSEPVRRAWLRTP